MASSITQLIHSWNEGDEGSLDSLINLAYERLHKSAHCALGSYSGFNSIQATELVNELYCHFKSFKTSDCVDSEHFFAIASCRLRQILQQRFRKSSAIKRDFGQRIEFHELDQVSMSSHMFETLVFGDAIEKLKRIDPNVAKIVELRTFWEFSVPEILEILQLSEPTYYRRWNWAKAWLRHKYDPAVA